MTLRGTLIVLLIAAIAGLTWWFNHLDSQKQDTQQVIQDQGPDYYMHDYVMTVTDKAGHLKYQSEGKRLVHLQQSDTGELDEPRFVFYREQQPPVSVRAERGWVSSGGEEVHLLGKVVLNRPADATREALQVDTQDLRLRPQEQTVATDAAIIAKSPLYTVQGVGLRANLLDGRLLILSNARGDYAP